MALTRKLLSSMGIEDDKADQIIEAHAETVNGLKDELDKAKADGPKVETLERQIADLRAELAEADKRIGDGDGYKAEYEKVKQEFETFKAETEAKATRAVKEKAYRQILADAGISEHRLDFVTKYSAEAIDALELDESGKPKDAAAALEAVKTEWGDFIAVNSTQGAKVPNPPSNTGGKGFEGMSLADKMKYANEHPEQAEAVLGSIHTKE